ncbi:MAG: hypothetical protein ACREXR_00385 [Gammaproteobacteria bacterium]
MTLKLPFRAGSHLVIDDVHGEEHYIEDVVEDWDGSIVHKNEAVGEHPSLTYRAFSYETFPELIRIPVVTTAYSTAVSQFVGVTTVTAKGVPFSRGG